MSAAKRAGRCLLAVESKYNMTGRCGSSGTPLLALLLLLLELVLLEVLGEAAAVLAAALLVVAVPGRWLRVLRPRRRGASVASALAPAFVAEAEAAAVEAPGFCCAGGAAVLQKAATKVRSSPSESDSLLSVATNGAVPTSTLRLAVTVLLSLMASAACFAAWRFGRGPAT